MADSADAEKPNRGHELFLVQLVFVLVAGVTTLIRAYVKVFLVGRVTSDDYLILAAMVKRFPIAMQIQHKRHTDTSNRRPMPHILPLQLTALSTEQPGSTSLKATAPTKQPSHCSAGISAKHYMRP